MLPALEQHGRLQLGQSDRKHDLAISAATLSIAFSSVAGSFIHALTMVDVATGWTECLPLLTRERSLVVEAIYRAQSLFPWLLRGVNFDKDGAFMNDVVVPWSLQAQATEPP